MGQDYLPQVHFDSCGVLLRGELPYFQDTNQWKRRSNGGAAIDAWHQHMNRSQDTAVNGKPVVQQLLEKPTWRRTVGPSCVLEQAGHSKITDQTEQARDEDERLCCRQFRTDETGPWLSVSTYFTNCATCLKTKAAAPNFRGRPLSFRRRKFLLLWRRLRCHLRRHLRRRVGDRFRIRRNCARHYRGGVGVDLPGQVKNERCDFERHLLAFGYSAHRLGLQHFDLVAPRVHLDASAEWQCDDLSLGRGLRIGGGACVCRFLRGWRRGGSQRQIDGDAITQVRADQVRDVLLPSLQGIEEELRRGELVSNSFALVLAASSSDCVREKPKCLNVSFSSNSRRSKKAYWLSILWSSTT